MRVAGMDSIIATVVDSLILPLCHGREAALLGVRPPRGILLHGPSGVGKTALVRALCEEILPRVPGLSVRLLTVRGPDVVSLAVGESEARLRRLFHAARAPHPKTLARSSSVSILFFDEVDALCPRRAAEGPGTGGQASAGGTASRLVAQLLTLMDGVGTASPSAAAAPALVIIGATNRLGSVDPALRRPGRFDFEQEVPPPGPKERAAILRLLCGGRAGGLSPNAASFLPDLAECCVGYTGADLCALVGAALSLRRGAGDPSAPGYGAPGDRQLLQRGHLEQALRSAERASSLRGGGELLCLAAAPAAATQGDGSSPDPSAASPWDAIGGMAATVTALREAVERPLRSPEAYRRMGVSVPRGILLHGPPGNSKTSLVRVLAAATRMSFLTLSGAAVYSPFLGEAEKAVREAFARARLAAPSLLFLDEIDALVGRRGIGGGGGGHDVSTGVLATLLTEMDGVQAAQGVLVVAATNRPRALDPALLRPGRLEMHLHVPAPDSAGREEVLRIHSRGLSLAGDVDLGALAGRTHGWSGAALENLCREAAMQALRRVGVGAVAEAAAAQGGAGAFGVARRSQKSPAVVMAADFEAVLQYSKG